VVQCALLVANSEAFGAQKYLSMTYIGEGSTDPPVGLHDYSEDDRVTVTATPAEGWYFDHWEGNLSGSTNPGELTMNADKRVSAVFMPTEPTAENALARYVGKLDTNYTWYQHDSDSHFGWTKYTLRMTSQQWRNSEEVDRVLWEHDVGIIEPWFGSKKVLLFVNGGDNGDPPEEVPSEIALASWLTGIKYAQVDQVPNQPLKFSDENNNGRKEDEILGYALDKALSTGDQEWVVHMAMAKAAIRAMDVVQEKLGTVEDFMVAGASKRGWTTYLASAIDPRVKAMVPISIDIPNLRENMKHHWEAYGFYAPAVDDFVDFDLLCRMEDPTEPHAEDVVKIVDPLTYFPKYTMPKLILVSVGDQFFLPDSSRFYYSDLPGVKNLRCTVNTDHSQEQAVEELLLFALSWAEKAMYRKPLPEFTWKFESEGSIRVETQTVPKAVRLWQAHNPDARDFRLESIGPVWTSSPLSDQGDGVFIGYVSKPQTGWTAFLVELDFDDAITLTTEVGVTPDTLPFEGTHCRDSDDIGFWKNAVDLGNGWKWLDWFGKFYVNSLPWIYHLEHQWLYPYETSADGIFFWDSTMSALWWTRETVYPFLYRYSDDTWLWYHLGSSAPCWFYNYRTSMWESY
jgi:PhoPQ-activated pathogenicity-related protein